MRDTDRRWIEVWNDRINWSNEGLGLGHSKRLELWEFKSLLQILENTDDLVIDLVSVWGFHILLKVYEDSPCLGIDPECILILQQDQLPGKLSQESTWEILNPLYASKRNAQKRKFYGWCEPQPYGHFTY